MDGKTEGLYYLVINNMNVLTITSELQAAQRQEFYMSLSQLSFSGIVINIGRSVGVGAFVGEGKNSNY